VAVLLAAMLVTASIFCCGYLPVHDTVWPFRLLFYILPARWTFGGVASLLVRERDMYSGAQLNEMPSNSSDHRHAYTYTYSCPGEDLAAACFGATGFDVALAVNAYGVDAVTPYMKFGAHVGWLCLMAAVARLIVLVLLVAKPWARRWMAYSAARSQHPTEATSLLATDGTTTSKVQ